MIFIIWHSPCISLVRTPNEANYTIRSAQVSSSMKGWIGGVVAAVALSVTGVAQAAITWTQTYSPAPSGYVYLSSGNFTYYHDLAEGFMAPLYESLAGGRYSNSTDSAFTTFSDYRNAVNLTGATLTLYFADDYSDSSAEYVKFRIEDNSIDNDWSAWSTSTEINGTICPSGSIFVTSCRNGYDDVSAGSVVLDAIRDDNKLKVELDPYGGDFYFKGSILTIVGEAKPRISTPEPATLGLMGLGLMGMGVLRRRKANA